MLNPQTDAQPLYPIREVSKLTGVNAITLRAWERRYGLIEPIRTESGHRLYTQQNIDLLNQVVKLTQQGVPIGQVKAMLPKSPLPQVSQPENYQTDLLEAITRFDVLLLSNVLDQVMADLPQSQWQNLFMHISQTLHAEDKNQRFWESNLLPRLYHHLHMRLRHIAHPRMLLVLSSVETLKSCTLLKALKLADEGYYPLVQDSLFEQTMTEKPAGFWTDEWVAELQQLQIEGIALVAQDNHALIEKALAWQDKHPSFGLWVFTPKVDQWSSTKLNVFIEALSA